MAKQSIKSTVWVLVVAILTTLVPGGFAEQTAVTPAETLSQYKTLTVGYTGPEVTALKQRMYELGYYKKNTVNESFTANTADYVKEFEQINGLYVDGITDPEMQSLFFSEKALNADGMDKNHNVRIEPTKLIPVQDIRFVTDTEKHQIQKMIMDFKNVDSMDLPYDKIKNLLKQDDDKKYEVYRQELRAIGCTNEDEIYTCAKWKYALDFFIGGSLNNSKADDNYGWLETYVTHEQINHYALTGEGLNVYRDDEGKSKFLLVHTDKKADKAFRAAIDWYKINGAGNVVEVLSDMGFCIWFPYVFNQDTGYGMALFDWKTGVIHQNADADSIKKYKDEGLRNSIIRLLPVESMGIAHGRVMGCLTDPDGTRKPGGFTFGAVDLEVVKALMVSFNLDFLFEQTGNKIFKDFSVSAKLAADDYAKRYGKNVDDPFILRQLEMMTLGGLTTPLGADNWEFAREKIEELKSEK